jgi:hypothetical protein
MPKFPTDTHPEVAELQFEMLRQATMAQRIKMMRSLTQMAVRNSKRAIRRARPELSEQERALFFIELNYGGDLADQVRAQLES